MAKTKNSTIEVLPKILYWIIVAISVFVMVFSYIYNKETIGVFYISDQNALDIQKITSADDLENDELSLYEDRVLFNINYFDNSRENGIELNELRLDYFTSYTLLSSDYRSSGMQNIGELSHSWIQVGSESEANEFTPSGLTYYDTTDGISYIGYTGEGAGLSTKMNRNAKLIVKIDNKPYQIQLTGTKTVVTHESGFLGIKKKITNIYYYNWLSIFDEAITAVKTNSHGYGDFYITLPLQNYFTIKKINTETGEVENINVDEIYSYAVAKIHYEANGARQATQSLFGLINGDNKYGINEQTSSNYWKAKCVYTLNPCDLTYRYSSVYDGYFASLTPTQQEKYKNLSNIKVNLNIDLDDEYLREKNINLIGFDYSAFKDFEIDTISILSDSNRTINFTLLENSLINSNVKVIRMSPNINLIESNNSINSNYRGVMIYE